MDAEQKPMTDILELAKRVGALDAGNTLANLTIWKTTRPDDYRKWESGAKAMGNRDASEEENVERIKKAGRRAAPDFTRSLDAAMTLVPEGYAVNSISQTTEVEKEEHTGDVPLPDWSVALIRQDCAGYRNRKKFMEAFKRGEAANPALALTAAALRAIGETK